MKKTAAPGAGRRRMRGRPRGESPESLRIRVLTNLKDRLDAGGAVSFAVDDIASELRISKKTLYKIFATKHDLIVQLVDMVLEETGRRVDAIVGADERLARKLARLLAFFCLVFRRMDSDLGRELHFRMPDLWNKIEQFRERKLQENVSRLLDQGVRERVIRADVDRQLFLMAFIAAAQTLIRPSTLLIESRSPQQVVTQLITMMYTGIMTPAGREEFTAATQHPSSV